MRIFWLFVYSTIFFSVVFLAITILHGSEKLLAPNHIGHGTHQIGERFGWPHSFVVADNNGEAKIKVTSFVLDFGLLVILPSLIVTPLVKKFLARSK